MNRLIILFILIYSCYTLTARAQKNQPKFTPVPDSLSKFIDSLVSVAEQLKQPTYAAENLDTNKIVSVQTDTVKTKRTTGIYKFKGTIKDKFTGETIPFATVFFKGTAVGTVADVDGNFYLECPQLPKDSISVQAIGYKTASKKINSQYRDVTLHLELENAENVLAEFIVRPGEDPAITLVKAIIAHKNNNNPKKANNYHYESYNKLEIDIQRLSREQFEKIPIPSMKEFSFIYDNLDTTSEEQPFLPFYFTETLSDYYFQRDPKRTREYIKASQIRGVKNESVTEFVGSLYQQLNCYDNFIPIFDKQYLSPISNEGLFYYKYKIKDTQTAFGHPIILVQFVPKRSGENCFSGDFWVVDSVYAIHRINMKVPKDANINWVSRLHLYQEFAPIQDSFWFSVKDKFIVDFALPFSSKLPGFIGRKTTSYQNIQINQPSITAEVNDPKWKHDVIVADTARIARKEFWESSRHDTLSKNELAIYKMMDTLEQMPLFKAYKNTIKFLATGYKDLGKFQIGPIWNIYNRNPIEGNRFRIGVATTPLFFKDLQLTGYVAYGTKDHQVKYKATALWLLQREPRMYLYGQVISDIDRSTSYYESVSNDNLFATLIRKRGVPWKLAFTTDRRIEFYKEYYSGFSHMVSLIQRNFNPYLPLPDVTIFENTEGQSCNQVNSTEINFKFRYSYKEKFLEGNYLRTSLGSRYPVVELRYGIGFKNFLNGDYDFQKVAINITDNIKLGHLGKINYNIFAGQYFGKLPYALLEIHQGNEFLYFHRFAYNMMNRFEFISDHYMGLNIEHSIGGGVFNYIPVLKKAKLRQFWNAKMLYGGLNPENTAYNLNKGYPFRTLQDVPYIELSTGVGNILQLFRIDFVWRVAPKMLPNEAKEKYFGIFGSVQFRF